MKRVFGGSAPAGSSCHMVADSTNDECGTWLPGVYVCTGSQSSCQSLCDSDCANQNCCSGCSCSA